MTKKELQRAIFEAPEDAELVFITENQVLKLQAVELITKELRSVFSEDVSLLQHQIRITLQETEQA